MTNGGTSLGFKTMRHRCVQRLKSPFKPPSKLGSHLHQPFGLSWNVCQPLIDFIYPLVGAIFFIIKKGNPKR